MGRDPWQNTASGSFIPHSVHFDVHNSSSQRARYSSAGYHSQVGAPQETLLPESVGQSISCQRFPGMYAMGQGPTGEVTHVFDNSAYQEVRSSVDEQVLRTENQPF